MNPAEALPGGVSSPVVSRAQVIADRYQLVRPIGRGTTGTVYVARDLRADGRFCALKLIPARGGLTHADVARFATDVRKAAEVLHPGMVVVHEVDYDARAASLLVAMELLHGQTLRDVMTQPDTRERRLDLLELVLGPLASAHEHGLVHRDLEPRNVFAARRRSGEEVVKLLDVGLARILIATGLGAPGMSFGSPEYMAPEQLDGSGRVGPPTDVWAFGVMLYEALSDRLPFSGAPAERARAICAQPHVPLEELATDLPTGMARLADLCLEKDPARRPQDARALLRLMKSLRGAAASLLRMDGPVMDTVMDSVGSAPNPPPPELEQALRRSPRDPAVHRALLAFYRDADVMDGVWLAAAALEHLGVATREEMRLHHHYRRPAPVGHDRGLDAGGWAALLHHDQDPRIDAVWTEISEALLALHRRDDDQLGLHEAKKLVLGRPTDELARWFALAVGALRPGFLPRLYRGAAGSPPRHVPATPPASVFPSGFEEPLPAGALPFAVGRHVAYYRPAHRVCTVLHEPEALESVFEAALSLGLGWPTQRAEQARMSQLLAQQLRDMNRAGLRGACARLGTSARHVDLGTWRRAVELSCARAGLLLSGDLGGAAWMLRWLKERRRIPSDDAIDDLITFWSSGAHVRLRHQIGLAVRTHR